MGVPPAPRALPVGSGEQRWDRAVRARKAGAGLDAKVCEKKPVTSGCGKAEEEQVEGGAQRSGA